MEKNRLKLSWCYPRIAKSLTARWQLPIPSPRCEGTSEDHPTRVKQGFSAIEGCGLSLRLPKQRPASGQRVLWRCYNSYDGKLSQGTHKQPTLCAGGWTRDSLTTAFFRIKQLLVYRYSIALNLCLHFRAQLFDEFCIVSTGRVIKYCRGVV